MRKNQQDHTGENVFTGLHTLLIERVGSSVGKESSCNVREWGLIPGSGRSPGEGHGNPFSILAGRIPWTEEPGKLQSMLSEELDTT